MNLPPAGNPRGDEVAFRRVRASAATAARGIARRARRDPPNPAGEWNRAQHDDVVACYRLLLGRRPDRRGLRDILHNIDARPIPIDELVSHFLSSPEFRDRLQALVDWSGRVPIEIEVEPGMRLLVDPEDPSVGTEMRISRAYEPHVTRALVPRLRTGSVFVDVGASIGYYSVLAARSLGPEGRVVACEPGAQNHPLFLLNMLANAVGNVRLERLAIGRAPGVALYSAAGANGVTGPFDGDPCRLATKELVEVQPLDVVLRGYDDVSVIKVDVEGAEGLVLLGAIDVLRRDRPVVFLEFNGRMIRHRSRIDPIELLAKLEVELDYRVAVVRKDGSVDWMDGEEIVRLDAMNETDHLDIMAEPLRAA